MPPKPEEAFRARQDTGIAFGALVGVAIIALVQMLSVSSLDVPLKVSIYGFAVSVPSLTAVVLCLIDEARHGIAIYRTSLLWLVVIGNLASFAGISGLFFHFSSYAGITFVTISAIGFGIWTRHRNNLKDEDKP